ncbi:glycosyltransferase family 1 protein [Phreatobacter cathodiphilus]|uniref:Glycosyl transferase n=1 Tax=Phreatobacter cathodiphilus TaxID=1868589 RepID=A0A2S0NE76_9HYPH|nr:glycosyltransferase family 1 protein [Phreatobacter cathodiphilus]AVO46462.1 glycosyl transferase [Phreatobacter cathodiphilus]
MNAINRRPQLVCFSHLRWDFVFQRPQHLLSRAALDHDVYFIEEPLFDDGACPQLQASRRPEGVTVLVPVLPPSDEDTAASLIAGLLKPILQPSSRQRILWYYTPMAMAFSRDLEADVVVYDNMDELSAFRGAPPRLLDLEAELFSRADMVFTGGMSLYAAKRRRHRNVHPFPSSIDVAHFDQARRRPAEPADQAVIGGPRAGFFGVIDERMDLDLVAETARLRPDWQFVMIGPVVKIDPASLPRAANIHWLGGKSYRELPAYLGGWDVGLMPFALNESTRFISPTKTPEFLAAGLPVLSTAIADVISPYGERGLVDIVSDATGLADGLDRLRARPRGSWLAAVDAHLAGMSWNRTWAGMQRLIQGTLQSRRQPTGLRGRSLPTLVGETAHV